MPEDIVFHHGAEKERLFREMMIAGGLPQYVIPGVREANVYGVTVPGMDGRAGMAALVVDGVFDVAGVAPRLALPHYAKPVFLRLQPEIAVTGTFKQRKVELVKEGFDPSALPDPVYWLNPASGGYEKLTPAIYAEIVEDRVKI